MPTLAAFPKAFMDPLCILGEMTIRQCIELAATLDLMGWSFTRDSWNFGTERRGASRGGWARPWDDDPDALLLASTNRT